MPKYAEGAVSPSGKFVVQGGQWVPIEEPMPDTSQGGTNFGDRARRAMELARAGVPSGMMPSAVAEEGPEKEEAQRIMMASAALPAIAAVAPTVGGFLATPVGGGVIGAIPGITKGDPWQAAKGAAIGAATGGVGGNLGKILPFLMRLRTGANVAKAAPAVVEAAEAAAPVAAATRAATPAASVGGAAGREAFEAQSAELAKMLGQPPSGAAPAVWNTVSSQATQIANKLRQVAETSATNKKLVMDAIKSDFEAAGFPTWQAFRDFVFQARTRMP